MGCHPNAVARMGRNIVDHPDATDFWLDQLFDALTRATEWDAEQWQLDPRHWMVTERSQLARNALSRRGPPGIRA